MDRREATYGPAIAAAWKICDKLSNPSYVPDAAEQATLEHGQVTAARQLGEWDPLTGLLEDAVRKAMHRCRRAQAAVTVKLTEAIRECGVISPGAHLHTQAGGDGIYLVSVPHHVAESLQARFARERLSHCYGVPVEIGEVSRGRVWSTVTMTVPSARSKR